ncbi:MAG: SEL1-like repeat protein [Rhodospirillales bacterium]|nr:SEL1-like repeat protein [Rhodospirillales bacterium]
MGFKRTSEGRIFFQSPEDEGDLPENNQDSAAAEKKSSSAYIPQDMDSPFNLQRGTASRPSPKTVPKATPMGNAPTQMQIIALLKTLNERLKITQGEREKMARELEEYRKTIEELQAKTARSDKAYQELSKKLAAGGNASHAETLARDALAELEETRRLVLDLETKANRADQGVSALKKIQSEHTEKMTVSINHAAALTKRVKDTEERQEKIGARVDDALSQQARLSRRIDKAVEERTRFLRKLERIEETVLQTRDSLNAKAMVLLTDQAMAAASDMDQLSATDFTPGEYAAQAHVAQKAASAARQNRILQMVGMSLLVTAALLGGWLISELQKPESAPVNASSLASAPVGNPAAPMQDMAAMEWQIEQDTSAFDAQGRQSETIPAANPAQNDIGTLNLNDQAQVEALLEGSPDAVVAALNNIDPGSESLPENIIPPQAEPEAMQETAPQKLASAPARQSPQEPTPKSAEAKELPPLILTDPRNAIKPDSNLPDVIKNIEAQAFEGVPEAQHDLAAIYTAGHGGVKQDYARAAFWFEQAASRGVANAAYNLGVLNHQGLSGEKNLGQAIEWYTRAANLGHPEAQYNLGIAYIEGIGVPYDAEKASRYFENAAKSGIMEAAYNLGLIYENGLLGQAEPDRALVWYKNAADQGSPEAKQALEQLAKTLKVSLDDVNDIADRMSTEEGAQAANAIETSAGDNAQAVTAQVQEYLMRSGLYPGPADGISGPLTEDAIRSYQRTHNLQADGKATQNLLSHMLANTAVEQGSGAQ